jgi:hypothetical protein
MRRHLLIPLIAALAATALSAAIASTASAAGVCSASTPQYCPAPSAATGAASSVSTTSATLNGTANPQGAATSCAFLYGTTTSYGQATPAQSVGSGTANVSVSAAISGLSANTPYHFQLVCANVAGSLGFGGDKTFSTLSTTSRSKVAIGKRKETVSKNGTVKFSLSCKSSVKCAGRLTLKSSGTKLANAKSYSIAGGKTKLISMKLTKKGLKRLKKKKHHRLAARAAATDNDGASAKRAVTLILHK